jgi:hypothetical protein
MFFFFFYTNSPSDKSGLLYLKGLSEGCSKRKLKVYFRKWGHVLKVKIYRNERTQRYLHKREKEYLFKYIKTMTILILVCLYIFLGSHN